MHNAMVELTQTDDLATALASQPEADAAYRALPPSHQREYLKWIAEAKKPQTRQLRIEKTIEKMLGASKTQTAPPPLFRKLNLGEHRDIVVLNPPKFFKDELSRLTGLTVRHKAVGNQPILFSIAFVQTLAAIDAAASSILPKAVGDAIVWFAYPKSSSKRYKCEFNRDTGWAVVRQAGFDTVRAVSIDEDWSALRFRRVEFIGR